MSKDLFYIVDAGSTKTDLAIIKGDTVILKSFKGFNPNNSDFSIFNELNSFIKKNKDIYFYGSGLSNQKNKQLVIKQFSNNTVDVYSDVLGAARALYGKNKGLVTIMGTGGVVAYYDGNSIIETKGGYGYLIDDIGGGLELAKNVVSKWLNKEFDSNTSVTIQNYFDLNPNEFISWFYQTKNLQKLTSLCTILPQLIDSDSRLESLILDYFDLFINKHILLLAEKYKIKEISSVGSIAYNFRELYQKSLINNGLILNNIESKPILKLIEFHKLL